MPEKILLYNVKEPQDIIKVASNMRIASGFINESDSYKTLAELAAEVKAYHQMWQDIIHRRIRKALSYSVM